MGVGGSFQYGKIEIVNFLKERTPLGSSILDVGAGCGTYGFYLGTGYRLDAVELWKESVKQLTDPFPGYYSTVYQQDIREFQYPHDYDLVIFGDILEHLSVKDAQAVVAEAQKHSKHILIAIPYLYEQDEMYGNSAEKHLQPDLTHQIFKERYPGFDLIFGKFDLYGYYYK